MMGSVNVPSAEAYAVGGACSVMAARRVTLSLFAAAFLGLMPVPFLAADGGMVSLSSSEQPAGTISLSLQHEVDAAIARGLEWLAARQNADGSWSAPGFPAITALAMRAFVGSQHAGHEPIIKKATAYLLTCRQADGGIYGSEGQQHGGGLRGYNTAICMMALHAGGDAALAPVILAARDYVAKSQQFGETVNEGEFGYDRDAGRGFAELLNTYYAAQAMRLTESAEGSRPSGTAPAALDWQKVIERVTALRQAGDSPAPSVDAPIVFRAYGSMTYAGLMALLYADVQRDDPRVLSALDWCARHWSLYENPGMGQQGLFFFFNVLTRALSSAGQDFVARPDGSFVNWRQDLAARLVSLQRIDPANGQGYWENPDGRFWENDPVLVTAYCLFALESL